VVSGFTCLEDLTVKRTTLGREYHGVNMKRDPARTCIEAKSSSNATENGDRDQRHRRMILILQCNSNEVVLKVLICTFGLDPCKVVCYQETCNNSGFSTRRQFREIAVLMTDPFGEVVEEV